MTDQLRQDALKQALNCIKRLNKHGWILADHEDEVYSAIIALKAALKQQPVQEQQQARVDVITVTLMREGINKHKARELADHFVNFTLTPPLPAQPLTHDEIEAIGDKVANEQLVGPVANFRVRFARAIEAKLKENT
jgi:hypothetical protein